MWHSGRTRSAGGVRCSHPVVARASSGGAGHGQSWAPGNPANLQLELASRVVVGFVPQDNLPICLKRSGCLTAARRRVVQSAAPVAYRAALCPLAGHTTLAYWYIDRDLNGAHVILLRTL